MLLLPLCEFCRQPIREACANVGLELTFVPTKALVRVDLPALGAPTTPTCNSCCCSVGTAGVSGLYGSGTYSVTCSSSSTPSSQAGKLLYTRCKSCRGVVCLQLCGRPPPAHVTSARLLAKSFKLVSAHTRGRLPPTPVATAEHSVKPIFASMERAIFRTLSSRVAFTASLDCGSSSQGACKVRFDQLCSECRCRNTSRCWRYDGRLDLSKFALTYLYQLLILLGLGAICLVGHGRQLD